MSYKFHRGLSNIATGWQRPTKRFIGDLALPRVDVADFVTEYYDYDRDWVINETLVGKKGLPVSIGLGRTSRTLALDHHALMDELALQDVVREEMKAPAERTDLRAVAVENVLFALSLAAEKRVADFYSLDGNFDTVTTLSGNSQWSDKTNSNPVTAILEAIEGMAFCTPTHFVMGSEVWAQFRAHPKVVEAVVSRRAGAAAQSGIVMGDEVAALFGLTGGVLVGAARYNSANRGGTETVARMWGKSAALVCLDPLGSLKNPMPTWAIQPCVARRRVESEISRIAGSHGIEQIKVSECCTEHLISSELGYKFKSAVA